MNLNNKLPPSPRARHARKPLIKLVGHHETLSLDRNKQEPTKNTNNYSLDRLKTNSIDQNTKPYQNQQEKSKFFQQKDQPNKDQKQCHNHKGRIAVSMVEKRTTNYYCFECSLYQARRGNKVKQINMTGQNKKEDRENQIKRYIEEAQQTEMSLSHHYNELKNTIKRQVSEVDCLIEREKSKTAQRIAKLKQDLGRKIEELEKVRYQQVRALQKHCKDLGEMRNVVKCNRLDVMSNLQGCLYEFSLSEFTKIMGQYESQLKHSKELIKKSGVCMFDAKLKHSDLVSFESAQKSSRDQFFTFSKNGNQYETPKIGQKLEGVPTVSSSYGIIEKSSKENAERNIEKGQIIINCFN